MPMDISEIRMKYNNGNYTSHIEIPAKVKSNHVFDEELSVKRNREMAEEHNKKVDELRTKKRNEQDKRNRQLVDDVVGYIMDCYDMSEEQARIVERFVYVEKHSAMCDYFSGIDSIARMVEEVIEVGMLDYMEQKKNNRAT